MPTTRRRFLGYTVAASAVAAACTTGPGPRAGTAPRHVVLLGDSIFDNGAYVPGQPCVIDQLRGELGSAQATLLAHDGDVTADVAGQLERVPADATHLVVSAGGNDALQHRGLLGRRVENAAELLGALAVIRAEFARSYERMLDAVLGRGLPTAVCTIYDSNFEPPRKQLADVALCVFNDAILRAAGERGLPVVDLRRIFTAPGDYANAIEPSSAGGARMVAAIVRALREHDFAGRQATLHA